MKVVMKDCKMRRLVIAVIGILVFFLVVAILMWIWNKIIPWVIGFPPVTYWQAAGLIIVIRILFGGIRTVGCCACRYKCFCRSKPQTSGKEYMNGNACGSSDTVGADETCDDIARRTAAKDRVSQR